MRIHSKLLGSPLFEPNDFWNRFGKKLFLKFTIMKWNSCFDFFSIQIV